MSEHPVTKRALGRRETLDLMASARVGRVVVSEGALPAVHVVAFALDRECVVFRAPIDSPLARAALDAVVAFQADRIDPAARTGWTGTITGHASRVRDPSAVVRLDRLLPEVDGDDGEQAWIRVSSEFVTGLLSQRRTTAGPSPEPDAQGARTPPFTRYTR
ncbi:pyridoxamine 5'-phosphate oxidase family protein [Embleya scabrispora]|uniref:pyridoxamine 5'-phosphate oxidase family protein n=1 Tax=Embleya scabrispora TaxID=159449 RepID=UPI00036AC3F5|nr:pyridoxamine 5'-phosphate oxidase family protein [Embleya scabrispora]MYS86054.1 pyridoxamine 5'-phosphate oxidase family protein [Streptomyces sp. SID5474]